MLFDLKTPIEQLYLVGPARAKILKKLGINTLGDLLFYFPRKHQDLSVITNIAQIKPDEFFSIKAKVLEIKSFRTKVRHLNITHALVEDNTGSILCVWFNQPFLSKTIKSGEIFLFAGKVTIPARRTGKAGGGKNSAGGGSASGGKLTLQNPIYEQVKDEQVHTARLVPVYSLTSSLTQKQLRSIIKLYLDKTIIPEYLPQEILKLENLPGLNLAVKTFHFPSSKQSLRLAQTRLAFDEIFQNQIKVLQFKKQRQQKKALIIQADESALKEKITTLPFLLTESQNKALAEIKADLVQSFPANRLLEGDVGSGKTIVAALSMWLVGKNNLQAALLAPTEVLAEQHYNSLIKYFALDKLDFALLTSSNCKINGNPISRAALLSRLKSGLIKCIIGTHALLQPKIEFLKLALLVIDEQHRFGVVQRAALKQLNNAHLITMSATPIPRTLALTLYGDLDVSVLSEMPIGRLPIKNRLVSEENRTKAYDFIAKQIQMGRQAFVICPLIEESDTLGVKSAQAEYKKLKTSVFPSLNIGLMHGKLPAKGRSASGGKPSKESVMRDFMQGKINILVSTSVVEVGVDVPNASVMMIEGAERFGLAQLHQFRGRVGRSIHQSYCFLFSNDPDAQINPRLQAIVASTNGFELAEQDLKIRGFGDLYGTEQSGYNFKIATLANLEIVERSRTHASKLLEQDMSLSLWPKLKEKIDQMPLVHLE